MQVTSNNNTVIHFSIKKKGMVKELPMIIPLIILLCFAFGCQQQGEEVAEDAAPEELIPPNLKDAHNTWFEGLLAEDTSLLEGVLSDDVTFGWPDGGRGSKDEFLSFIQSGRLFYDTAEHEDVRFRVYENMAVVTGRSNLAYRIRGKKDFERLTYTAVYVKTERVWKMVAWQSARRP